MKTTQAEIEELKQELGPWSAQSPIERRAYNMIESLLADLEELQKERDEAYERAAQVCEERGGMIGGAIDPARTAKAIRALKSKPEGE